MINSLLRALMLLDKTKLEVTSDGWRVVDIESFSYLVDYSPPRPSLFWRQIFSELCGLGFWLAILGGCSLLAIAVWLDARPIAIAGVGLIVGYFYVLLRYLSCMKYRVNHVGIVDKLRPHPLGNAWAIADVRLDDGRNIPVSVDRVLVEDILADGKSAEVLFNMGDSPGYGGIYGGVIGARQVQK